MVATRQKSPVNSVSVLADPKSSFFIGREEKFAYGAGFIGGSSAFTTYTYDAQSISTTQALAIDIVGSSKMVFPPL